MRRRIHERGEQLRHPLRRKLELGQTQREPVFLATMSPAIRRGDMTELREAIQCLRKGPRTASDKG